jgi:hypothetical protein
MRLIGLASFSLWTLSKRGMKGYTDLCDLGAPHVIRGYVARAGHTGSL